MSRPPAATDSDGWVAQLANSGRRQRAGIYLREAGQAAVPAVGARRGSVLRDVLIGVGTAAQLESLARYAAQASIPLTPIAFAPMEVAPVEADKVEVDKDLPHGLS